MHNLTARAEAAKDVSALKSVRDDFFRERSTLLPSQISEITDALVTRRTQLLNRFFLIEALNGCKKPNQVRSAIESAERSLRNHGINELDMIVVRCYTVPAWHRTATVIQTIPPPNWW